MRTTSNKNHDSPLSGTEKLIAFNDFTSENINGASQINEKSTTVEEKAFFLTQLSHADTQEQNTVSNQLQIKKALVSRPVTKEGKLHQLIHIEPRPLTVANNKRFAKGGSNI